MIELSHLRFFLPSFMLLMSICLPAVHGASSDGEVRLMDGTSPSEGRVEIFNSGQWKTICDDDWDLKDAIVVCRSVGFPGATEAVSRAGFGRTGKPILLENVNCSGTESNILECPNAGNGTHNCAHSEEVGVRCEEQQDGQVRLANGTSSSEGRVEILKNKQWGTICDDDWDLNDAKVVCRSLGFPGATEAIPRAGFGRGSGLILLDNVNCSGTESNILECPNAGPGIHDCGHSEDAGVRCGAPKDGQVRLVNGTSSSEGRVEIFYSEQWGTICDDEWDLNDAIVVCRSLGFPGATEAVSRAGFGQGSGPILLDNVDCSWTESNILECPNAGLGRNNCSHIEDAGVRCDVPQDGQVRLVDGTSSSEGRVEIFYNVRWGTICDDGWDLNDANVICQSLDFPGATEAVTRAGFGRGSGLILLGNVNCSGTELSVLDCVSAGIGLHDCKEGDDSGVRCQWLQDEEAPTLNCSDLISTTDQGLRTSSTIAINPGLSDNRDWSPSVACSHYSGDVFQFGDTNVTCNATDDSGNTGVCTFMVTIQDEEPPTLNCSDMIWTTDQGLRTSSTVMINPGVSDNTDRSPSVACSHYSDDVFQFGDTNVTCNATDDSGNTGVCTFMVTIQDNEPPSLECDNQTFTADQGLIMLSVIPPVSDNVDSNQLINCTPSSIDGSQLGENSITCQAEDSSGNTGKCRFLFIVQDPCEVHNPCINGNCSYVGSGHYHCECYDRYEGTHCDVIRKPDPSLEVDFHPDNQTLEIGNTVRLRCGFLREDYFIWYRNGHPLPSTRNNHTLTIPSVSPSDIGYYFCRGHGKGGRSQTIDTKLASLYVKGSGRS